MPLFAGSSATIHYEQTGSGPDIVWVGLSTPKQERWMAAHLGRIDARGHLHVRGRRDAVIITGGKKVQPAEVEVALRASGEFPDVAVIGVRDRDWGEAVVTSMWPSLPAKVPTY